MSQPNYLIGLFRRIRTRLLGREVEVVGQCRLCGECCRKILLMHKGRWLRKDNQYRELVESLPEYARFKPVETDSQGFMLFTCTSKGDDNICTSYETRPPLCRNYPAKTLYYQGGQLRDECGFSFKAVTFRDVLMGRNRPRRPSFSKMLDHEIEQDVDQDTENK